MVKIEALIDSSIVLRVGEVLSQNDPRIFADTIHSKEVEFGEQCFIHKEIIVAFLLFLTTQEHCYLRRLKKRMLRSPQF